MADRVIEVHVARKDFMSGHLFRNVGLCALPARHENLFNSFSHKPVHLIVLAMVFAEQDGRMELKSFLFRQTAPIVGWFLSELMCIKEEKAVDRLCWKDLTFPMNMHDR